MVMRILQQSYHLRELFGMREIATASGEELACRVFLNFDKLQANAKDHRSIEVDQSRLTQMARQLQKINQPFPKTHISTSSSIMLEIHIYITRSNLEMPSSNGEKGKPPLAHMSTLKVQSSSGKNSRDKSLGDVSSGNEEGDKADDSYNQYKSVADLSNANKIQVGNKVYEMSSQQPNQRPQRAKKLKNLKELINLVTAEHQHLSDLRTNKLLYLSDFRTLAQFMLYKMKQSDNFGNLMEQKIFDELNEIAEQQQEELLVQDIGGEEQSPSRTPQNSQPVGGLLEPPTPSARGTNSPRSDN